MARQARHWIWYAYLHLAAKGGMTEARGREFLKQSFPTTATIVDQVVAAEGRLDQLSGKDFDAVTAIEEEEQRHLAIRRGSAEMNANIRKSLGQLPDDYEPELDARPSGIAAAEGSQSINADIRAAANRGRFVSVAKSIP